MPERCDLHGQVLRIELDRAPIKSLAGQRKNVALLAAGQEEDQRLVSAQEFLRLLGLEWLRARQRRIARELLCEPIADRSELLFGVGDLPSQVRNGVLLAIRRRPREDVAEGFVQGVQAGGKVLSVAYER